jgi:hypothetical protein
MNIKFQSALLGAGHLFIIVIAPLETLGVEYIEQEKACEVHAAAMVAEMQAASKAPLSTEERALVRTTATKSCLTQAAEPAAPVVPEKAKTKAHEGSWSVFDPLLEGGTERSPGHERLRRRGRY